MRHTSDDSAASAPVLSGEGIGVAIAKQTHAASASLVPEIPLNFTTLNSPKGSSMLSDSSQAESGQGGGSNMDTPSNQGGSALQTHSLGSGLSSQFTVVADPSIPQSDSTVSIRLESFSSVDLPQPSGHVPSLRLNAESTRAPHTPLLSPGTRAASAFDRVLDAEARNSSSKLRMSQSAGLIDDLGKNISSGRPLNRQEMHTRSMSTDSGLSSQGRAPSKSAQSSARLPSSARPRASKPGFKGGHKISYSADFDRSSDLGMARRLDSLPMSFESDQKVEQKAGGSSFDVHAPSPNARLQPETDFIKQVQGVMSREADPFSTFGFQALKSPSGESAASSVSSRENPSEGQPLTAQGVFRDVGRDTSNDFQCSPQQSINTPHPGQSSLPTVPEEEPLDDTAPLSKCDTPTPKTPARHYSDHPLNDAHSHTRNFR